MKSLVGRQEKKKCVYEGIVVLALSLLSLPLTFLF